MLTDALRRSILKRFPDIKLSYDKTLHNKVYADLFMIVPKGPKAFLWFTYIDNNNVAIVLLLNKRGNIQSLEVYPMCFNADLSLGTLIYGTFFDVNGCHHFTCEEIYTHKSRPVFGMSLRDKLDILNDIFSRDLLQKSYNKQFIIAGLPVWTANYMSAVNISKTLPYKVYGIKFYNMKHHQGKSVGIYVNDEVVVKEGVFRVKAMIEPDIYQLHCYDNHNTIYGMAAVTSYKHSVMLNSLFRNIRENIELDYIEASDDEEDFENVSEDKYVDLDKTVYMRCVYNNNFKKWEPIEEIKTKTKTITRKEALSLEKNNR